MFDRDSRSRSATVGLFLHYCEGLPSESRAPSPWSRTLYNCYTPIEVAKDIEPFEWQCGTHAFGRTSL